MAVEITPEIIGAFIVFVLFVFLVSRVFKVVVHAIAIGAAGFAFPWAIQYLGLELGITASVSTGLQFAALGVGLYLVYEFFHLIKALFKIITLPLVVLFQKKDSGKEMKKIRNEIKRANASKK